MKKYVLLTLLGLIAVLISGCVPQTIYIQSLVASDNYITQDQTFEFKFKIINPTEYTFIGNITFDYNKDCIYVQPTQPVSFNDNKYEPIEVPPKKVEDGSFTVIKKFKITTESSYPYGSKQQCFQTPLKISAYLYDKSGVFKTSTGTTLTITKG